MTALKVATDRNIVPVVATLLAAAMPSLSSCRGSGQDPAVVPRYEAQLINQPSLSGPFAPQTLRMLINSQPYLGRIAIFEPGEPLSGAPSTVLDNNTPVIFLKAGEHTARIPLPDQTLAHVPFSVRHESGSYLQFSNSSPVTGTAPIILELKDPLDAQFSNWTLRAYQFNYSALQFELLPINTASGQRSELSAVGGRVELNMREVAGPAFDRVIYLQGVPVGRETEASCAFRPLFLLPPNHNTHVPQVGADLRGEFREGESFELELSGVNQEGRISMYPVLGPSTNSVDMRFGNNPTGARQTIAVQIPSSGASVTALWEFRLYLSHSNGSNSLTGLIPVQPGQNIPQLKK